MRNQIIRVNDELFLVKHTTGLHYESAAKEWNNIDSNNRSFKQNNMMYFCEIIEEASIIEEFTNKQEE